MLKGDTGYPESD